MESIYACGVPVYRAEIGTKVTIPNNVDEQWWARQVENMRRVLIGVAQRGETISYGVLAQEIGMHHRDPKFMVLLTAVCRQETALNRGRLCALVVRKSSGIPGGGYFTYKTAWDGKTYEAIEMWRVDRDWVWEYWNGRSYPDDD